mmetsp:Transcript_23492/g.48854  ORF Transcript_23492/g.48854 Transcript_23492/m.48854 type:complete len:301 (-) Transcript_23492:172-1074(-)
MDSKAIDLLANLCSSAPSTLRCGPAPSQAMPLILPQPPQVTEKEKIANDKKQLKRAANRRSAQLSRARKKQFIESLVSQNTSLQRRVDILRCVPDLVIVFNVSGDAPSVDFVSDKCAEFLGVEGKEMKGRDVRDYLDSSSSRLLIAEVSKAIESAGLNATSPFAASCDEEAEEGGGKRGNAKQELIQPPTCPTSPSDEEAPVERSVRSVPLPLPFSLNLVVAGGPPLNVSALGVCMFASESPASPTWSCEQCVLSVRANTVPRPVGLEGPGQSAPQAKPSSAEGEPQLHCVSDGDSSERK